MLKCGDYESITVSTTAIGFTATKLAPVAGDYSGRKAEAVLITVEDQPVRFRADGTDPSAAEGHPLLPGDERYLYWGYQDLLQVKFIRKDAADAKVKVSYFYRV
ncbi:MAG: hypothetical protein RBR16_13820 [Syntrophus sp. (in: bacteria)]|jgi:hypothetical protein|nr:hypothetical protein [Syntrophus sp. (in: bacteria)]